MTKINILITEAVLHSVEFFISGEDISRSDVLTEVKYKLKTASGKEVGKFKITGGDLEKHPEVKEILLNCARKLSNVIEDPINRELKMIEANGADNVNQKEEEL